MHLKIKPLNDTAREIYSDHGHFHEGDAGLDLYVLEDITVEPGETTKDRQFTLETVNCLGCCALGPVMVLPKPLCAWPIQLD